MNEQQKAMLDQQMKLQRGAAIIEGTQDKFRQDGYSNLLNKYGTKQDNSTAYQYNQEIITNDMELIRLYEGNGLFTKIIDRPSEEAVKHGFDIDYGDEDITEYVDDRMDDLELEEKFATAEKWARLYGGSIIVMLVDDGRGLEEPLDWSNVRSIEELRVFERAIVQPDYTSMYHFHFLDTINSNKPFGEPEYYQVFSIYGYFTVHRSRCLVFRNGRLPEQTTNAIYRYWGIPEYVKIKRALRECITSHEDGVKLLERSVQAIYKMKNLANMLSTEDGENKVLQRLQVIDMARGILNSIAIDTDGEDYDFKSLQMSGIKDVIDSTCNMLSAVTNIPQTILFGRSPAGMNSTGESDFENYYNMVENIQKQNMKANARTVIDLILKQGMLEGKIPEVPKYKMKFAALWSMSDIEQANVEQTKAQTEYTKAQTAQIYMDSNVLDPSEVRNSLASEGEFEVEEVISDEDLNLPDDVFDLSPTPMSVTSVNELIEIAEPDKKNDTDFRAGEILITGIGNDEVIIEDGKKIIVKGIKEDGGPGSGDWGHSGRPGKIGGSGGGGGVKHRTGTKESGYSSVAKERAAEKRNSSGKKNLSVTKDEAKKIVENLPKLEGSKFEKNPLPFAGKKESSDIKTDLRWQREENDKGIQKVPVSSLMSVQPRVDKRRLLAMIENDVNLGETDISEIQIVKYNGKNIVYDGNHRCSLAKIFKKESIEAHVYEFPDEQHEDGADYPAAAVIIINDGKILCASRRNNEGVCGPGGHVEEGETPEEAAVREAMEEFNVVPLNLQPVGEYKGSSGQYLPSKVYFTDQFTGTPEADGDEMLNERWMSLEELQSQLLFPPFEAGLDMLTDMLTGG